MARNWTLFFFSCQLSVNPYPSIGGANVEQSPLRLHQWIYGIYQFSYQWQIWIFSPQPGLLQPSDSSQWRPMIYGHASWPILIIRLEWKPGRSMISSGGPLLGILSALCLEMCLHFYQSGTSIFPNSHRAASLLCVGPVTFPPPQSSPTWLAHQAGQWVVAMYTAITQKPLSMSCN